MSEESLNKLLKKVRGIECGGVSCEDDNCPFNKRDDSGCVIADLQRLAAEPIVCSKCGR